MSVFFIVVPIWSTKKKNVCLTFPNLTVQLKKKKKKIQKVVLFISLASLSVEGRGCDNTHVHV